MCEIYLQSKAEMESNIIKYVFISVQSPENKNQCVFVTLPHVHITL